MHEDLKAPPDRLSPAISYRPYRMANSGPEHGIPFDKDVADTTVPPTLKKTPHAERKNACKESFVSESSLSESSSALTHHTVTEIMSPNPKERPPKRKRTPPLDTPASDPARNTTFLGRHGLGAYILSPESFPPSRVIYSNAHFVVIRDLFPKSTIHLLLLPRDESKQLLHPFSAFEDKPFLASVKEELVRVRLLAAKELKRMFGRYSSLEQAHDAAVAADQSESDLPPSREWDAEIISGVHAVPSMSHLHIHIISRDRHSECLKHRKHYNSFATDFLVPIDAFPLGQEDQRRHPGSAGYLSEELKCWRCGKDFGKAFARLKEHLEEEFNMWKKI